MIIKNDKSNEVTSFDKVKDTLKKSFNYFSIFSVGAIAIGSSLTTDVHASNVGNGLTDDDATATAHNFDTASKKLTIRTASTVLSVATGAITDAAVITSSIDILSLSTDSGASTFAIASVVLDGSEAGTNEGAIAINDVNDAVGDMTVTVAGAFNVDSNVTIKSLEETDSETLTVNFDGAVTIDDATIIDANDADVTGSVNVKVSAAAIFTGGVDVGGGTDAGDGDATLTFDGGAAQAVAGVIDGLGADNTGNLAITNTAGAVTFAGAIGGTNDLKTVTVGTSTDESAAVFNAAVSAQTITVQAGDATTGEDSTANFDAAVTGALVLAPSGGTATVSFVDGNAITALTGAITTTSTDGDDSFVQVDDAGGGAAAVQTFSGAIGTSSNKIGTLSIGGTDTDGGSGNFNGDVNVTNLTITAGTDSSESSLGAFAGDVTATTITLNDASSSLTATLELDTAAAKTIAGTISGASDGEGILKISGATKTVSGVVGGSSKSLRAIDIDAAGVFSSAVTATGMDVAAGIGVTFNDDLTIGATKTTLNDATAEIIFSGSGDQTVTGEIIGASAETGVIDVANTGGTVTFATAVGATELKEIELDASSTSIFSKITKSALIDVDGHMTVSENGNVANNLTLATTGTIVVEDTVVTGEEVFTVGSGLVDGSIAGTGNILMPNNLLDGEQIDLFAGITDDAIAAVLVDVELAVKDTALMTYTATQITASDDNDISMIAAKRSAADAGTQLNTTANVGRGMVEAQAAVEGNTTLSDIFFNVMNEEGGMSATADSDLAKQVAPQDDLQVGSAIASKAMTGSVQSVISDRMASLRSGDAYVAGMSAGENLSANSMFIQAFGSIVEQDDKIVGSGHQAGYDADTTGVAFGIDSITNGGTVIGLSVSMSNTDLEGKGTGKAKNDIDSYTASLYMDKTGDAGYLEGSLTFGISENASSRSITTAGIDRAYKGDYDAQQLSLKIGGGLPYEASNGAYVTPFASVTSTLIESDAYTETSNTASDPLRLRVDQDDINSVVGSVGIKAHYDTGNGIPMFSLAINNEFGDKDIVTTNKFQSTGGAAFKSTTALEEMSATLGLGYTFSNGNTNVNVGYEAEANNDDYLGHSGSLKLVTKF